MATVLPPPSKRLKTAAAARARSAVSPPLLSLKASIAYNFVMPTHARPKALSLLGHTDPAERLPYRFYDPLGGSTDGGGEFSQEKIIKAYLDGTTTTELQLDIPCRAEAVFRVKAVTRCSASISGHSEAILTTAFSPATSSRLATGSGDRTARIWDCDTGTPLHTLKGHTGWVLAVSWSPDARVLATGSMDATLRLWDPETGKPLGGPLKGHTKWLTSLSWEPYHSQQAGRPRLASVSKDSTLRIWDVVSGHTDHALTGHTGSVTCVKWGGTGRLYSASHDRTVKIWDAATGKCLHTLTAHAHWVNHLALSTDFVLRTGFFSPPADTSTTQLPQTASKEAKRQRALDRYTAAVASSGGGGERLVSASEDCTMYLWPAIPSTTAPHESLKPLARMHGHQKPVNQVVFSPSGQLLASASFDNHIKLWSGTTGAFVHTLRGHVGAVYQCAFSADSRLLVSGSRDSTLKVWDTRTGKLREDLPGHRGEVYAVDWGADGERVGSGGQEGKVGVWRH